MYTQGSLSPPHTVAQLTARRANCVVQWLVYQLDFQLAVLCISITCSIFLSRCQTFSWCGLSVHRKCLSVPRGVLIIYIFLHAIYRMRYAIYRMRYPVLEFTYVINWPTYQLLCARESEVRTMPLYIRTAHALWLILHTPQWTQQFINTPSPKLHRNYSVIF
jgi:hypothetical protein